MLLQHLENPIAYVPVDISKQRLIESAEELQRLMPALEILPGLRRLRTAVRVAAAIASTRPHRRLLSGFNDWQPRAASRAGFPAANLSRLRTQRRLDYRR
jgi:hypothetical protein